VAMISFRQAGLVRHNVRNPVGKAGLGCRVSSSVSGAWVMMGTPLEALGTTEDGVDVRGAAGVIGSFGGVCGSVIGPTLGVHRDWGR
jgi:hypothetical protein